MNYPKHFLLLFMLDPLKLVKLILLKMVRSSTVIVVFDRPVSIIEFQECHSILTSETIQFLGEGTLCKWATKNQLVISTEKYINANSVTISFLSEVLKEDDQKIAVPKSVNLVVHAPKVHTTSRDYLMITGPRTVPQCGEFMLVSHFSSLKGGGQKTPYLVLLADKLKLGTDYMFILTVTSPSMSSLRAEHQVTRVSYDAPVVSLYTSLSENSVSMNEKLHLYGEVTLPSCIKPPKPVRFAWAVNNPRVKFDFGSLYVPVYKAAAFTLPVGETVTFTLRTFLDTAMNESTFAFVTVQVVPQPIQAIIKGEPEVTVGSRSGTILLDGSESGEFGIPVVYQWSCHDKNNEPCYNMLETSQNNSLISRDEQRKSILKLLSSQLEYGKKLKFSLQVFSARNPKLKSNTTLDLNVVDGDIPQVWLQSVSVRGVPIRRRNPVNGVFTVPARMPVIIEATVSSMRAVQTLSWNITGFPRSYHYNDIKGSTKGETILTLPQGTVVEHGVYVINLKACDIDGVCGTTNLTLYAFPVVVLCHVYIEPYVAYGWTQAVVRACSVPTERTPLTYQLHMQSLEKLIPVTSLQFSYVFRFIGLPPPANSSTVFYTAKLQLAFSTLGLGFGASSHEGPTFSISLHGKFCFFLGCEFPWTLSLP
ncbi:uncharacterized protein LOC143236956 [Tachypleus tridentatus]|uniref:uncharacterized protein LOC143236956 n=1 Tax=Tachypleus tridentatus TaxID=6853 RepID=UPI003FD4486C